MRIFVVAAGYVGLTTASGFCELGHEVTVHDLDPERVAMLSAGTSPILEAGMEDSIGAGLAAGRLRFTTSPEPPAGTDLAIICVPTPADGTGLLDTSLVETVVQRLRRDLPAGATVVVRSTLPLHGPDRLRAAAAGGPGPVVLVNPEFMREGRALADFRTPSRIAVGYLQPDDRSAAEGFAALYAPLNAPVLIADAESVCLLKLASNVFLAAKVAFANELARLSDAIGADYVVVADGLGLDPRIGRAFLDAGPGFGGSCLPEQAEAIGIETSKRGIDAALMQAIAPSNRRHQEQIAQRLDDLLSGHLRGARVALLGLAFKAGTNDVRRSPALALAGLLRAAGAHVVAYDPVAAAPARLADPELETAKSSEDAVRDADAILIATEWAEFANLDWANLARLMRGNLVVDTRRIVDADAARLAGLTYVGLGRARARDAELAVS